MRQAPNTFGVLMRRPSAFVPVVMSLIALVLVVAAVSPDLIAHRGVGSSADEGGVAHIWQLLMTLQVPIVIFFAIKWLRRAPGHSLRVLALQAAAWLASCAPVYFLHL
jgi:hypothetical protein